MSADGELRSELTGEMVSEVWSVVCVSCNMHVQSMSCEPEPAINGELSDDADENASKKEEEEKGNEDNEDEEEGEESEDEYEVEH